MLSVSLNKTFPSLSLFTPVAEISCSHLLSTSPSLLCSLSFKGHGIILSVAALFMLGVRCSSVVRAFAYGAMGRRIDPSWGGPIELFLVPAGVTKAMLCAILSVGWCI